MKIKELIKTLRRFPKDAEVVVRLGQVKDKAVIVKVESIAATLDDLNQWKVLLDVKNK